MNVKAYIWKYAHMELRVVVLAQHGFLEIKCVGNLQNYSLNYLIFVRSKLALE
jgi:hypothetical protein